MVINIYALDGYMAEQLLSIQKKTLIGVTLTWLSKILVVQAKVA